MKVNKRSDISATLLKGTFMLWTNGNDLAKYVLVRRIIGEEAVETACCQS